MSRGVLAAITASARRSADARETAAGAAVAEAAAGRHPRGPEFIDRLASGRVAIVAECKRRSPSKGVLREPYDPVAIAQGYASADAAAISVLTEPAFFDGSLEHLSAVRAHVDVPLLRKDFVTTPFQIVEARAAGADAILLIVAAMDQATLETLIAEATRHEMAALVEVHSRPELEVALAAGATLIGVNCRNLKTLEVDPGVHDALVGAVPDHVTVVAESGLRTAGDLQRLRTAGYDAFLIGERFMSSPDPGKALAALLASVEGGSRR